MPSPVDQYWAALETSELGEKLHQKVDTYGSAILTRTLNQRLALAYSYYFGQSPSGVHATSQVLRGGEQGELAEVRVNHSRPLVNTLLNLITAPRIVWAPKATNVDYDSLRQCQLAQAVLEYYWSDKKVNGFCVRALEEALVFGEGFVLLQWDETSGEDFTADENGSIIKSGDVRLCNVSTWDVIRDTSKAAWDDLDWIIVRLRVNKWELCAKYPEQTADILAAADTAEGKFEQGAYRGAIREDTDQIPCFAFYHRKTTALPEGRETLFISDRVVLEDRPLSFDDLPLYRVAAGEMFATPFPYTPFFDILGVQEVIDSLETSIASNQTTFATQNVILPKGAEVSPDDLVGGLKAIYVDPEYADAVRPLQLTNTPPEVFKHLETLKNDQQLLIGLNSVVRGEAPSGDMSGSAMALLQSQALQQSSNIQSNYLRMVESLGNGLFFAVRTRLAVPLQVSLVGKSSNFLVEDAQFSGDSFDRIKKITVDIGNPLAQTPAGRVELAQNYLQMGVIKSPEQFEQVVSTGRLEPLTQSLQHELLLIRSENERMQKGEQPEAIVLDDHQLHAREHRAVLANPTARSNPEVVKAVLAHIDEHERLYYSAPPQTLSMMGQMPPTMPPAGVMPPPGASGPPGGGGEGGPSGAQPAAALAPPPGIPNGDGPPKKARLPTNPSTRSKWDPVTGGGAVTPGSAK